jgi:hypothetical protein
VSDEVFARKCLPGWLFDLMFEVSGWNWRFPFGYPIGHDRSTHAAPEGWAQARRNCLLHFCGRIGSRRLAANTRRAFCILGISRVGIVADWDHDGIRLCEISDSTGGRFMPRVDMRVDDIGNQGQPAISSSRSYEDEHHAIEPASDADRLRHLLDAKEASQTQLSRDTGLSKSTISEVLAGKKAFSRQMIRKLAEYFHLDVGVLAANI